jgi:PAS domain S-box-containing protein
LQKVFETMQDVVVILDYDHNITSVNQAAKDIFGETRINSDYSISVYNVFYEYPELLSKIVSSEKSESQITIRSQGENRYYKLNISVISDSGQTVIGKMLVFSDITQVTVYQEKLLSNANQLAKLSAFKDKLFTVVAHDIRDPLAVLINLTELLEEELEVLGSEHSNVFQEVSDQ